MTIEEFYAQGDFIPSYHEGECKELLWDDYTEAGEFYANNKDSIFAYTVVDGEGDSVVVEGIRWVNRLGYLFSRIHVQIPHDVEIEY